MEIVLDFDGTITAKDTIGCLGAFAVSRQQQQGPQPDGDPAATWDRIVAAYVDDHRQHVAAYSPAEGQRLTHDDERAFLHSLHHVDAQSLARVAASALFAGCTEQELFAAGQDAVRRGQVTARPGFAEFAAAAAAAAEGRARLSILSVNWSSAFIRGAVSALSGAARIDRVVSNDIAPGGAIAGPGGVADGNSALMTSLHKLQAFTAGPGARGTTTTVYFGDSTTDLECLVAADLGVVMADDGGGALMKTLARLGHHVRHVSDSARDTGGVLTATGPGKLVWARDFDEVLRSGLFRGLQGS